MYDFIDTLEHDDSNDLLHSFGRSLGRRVFVVP